MKYIFGIDIGGTMIKIGFFSCDLLLLDKTNLKTNLFDNGENILKEVADALMLYIKSNDIDFQDIIGIGCGVPGVVYDGMVVTSPNLGWKDKDVNYELNDLLPFKTIIRFNNDANLAAYAEYYNFDGISSLVMITLGTGIGAGLIIDGKIYEGSKGLCGEVGHIIVDQKHNIKCNCGNIGCFETVSSATGLVNIYKQNCVENKVDLKNIEKITCKDIFSYVNIDLIAQNSIDEMCMYIGKVLSILAITIDPQMMIIGGGVSNAGDLLLSKVKKYYGDFAFSTSKQTPIMISSTGNDAGLIGAALYVKRKR